MSSPSSASASSAATGWAVKSRASLKILRTMPSLSITTVCPAVDPGLLVEHLVGLAGFVLREVAEQREFRAQFLLEFARCCPGIDTHAEHLCIRLVEPVRRLRNACISLVQPPVKASG